MSFWTAGLNKFSYIENYDYLCSPKGKTGDSGLECGEIWLLATTLKNAKIHAPVPAVPDPCASCFCVFGCSTCCGAFLLCPPVTVL